MTSQEVYEREIAVNEILRKHIQVKQNFDMTTSIEIPNKEITVEEGIILADWLCPSKNKTEPMPTKFVTIETLDKAFHIFELTKDQKAILQNILRSN